MAANDDADLDELLAEAGMHADHPLFARAQAALQDQQEKQRLGLQEQLREKSNELKVSEEAGSFRGSGPGARPGPSRARSPAVVARPRSALALADTPLTRARDVAFGPAQQAKKRREEVGVDLYNFQQQLAKLQMQLEKAHEDFAVLTRARQEVRAC